MGDVSHVSIRKFNRNVNNGSDWGKKLKWMDHVISGTIVKNPISGTKMRSVNLRDKDRIFQRMRRQLRKMSWKRSERTNTWHLMSLKIQRRLSDNSGYLMNTRVKFLWCLSTKVILRIEQTKELLIFCSSETEKLSSLLLAVVTTLLAKGGFPPC